MSKKNQQTYDPIGYRGLYLDGMQMYDFKDKDRALKNYIAQMLARTQSMFEYTGLPDTVPQRVLELYNQIGGFSCWTMVPDKGLYVFQGGLGGIQDAYYMPTICNVNNPALMFNRQLKIGIDCVIMPSDSMYLGLLPIFRRYASAMVENDITLRTYDINARMITLLSAGDDRSKKGADEYIRHVENGDLSVAQENGFTEGIRSQPITPVRGALTDLIEYHQYLKAGWYSEIGLKSNYNMKREAINGDEAGLDDDPLLPLIDDMLRSRQNALKEINAKYGTDISVKLASSWASRQNTDPAPEPDPDPKEGDPE